MSDFKCLRCGAVEPMQEKPVPGKLGDTLLSNTCQKCWDEWDENQVMLINENRLNLSVPQHFEMLISEMKIFLNIAG